MSEKNMLKYEIYKTLYENLKKAMRNEFYYEAIFIEYAIFEDRFSSLLKHFNIPYLQKNGQEIKISQKIDKVKSRPEFSVHPIRKYLPIEFLDEIILWKEERNCLIHGLANLPYDAENIKAIAERGYDLLKIFCSKVKNANRYHEKMQPSISTL